jgi:hypothetical protein
MPFDLRHHHPGNNDRHARYLGYGKDFGDKDSRKYRSEDRDEVCENVGAAYAYFLDCHRVKYKRHGRSEQRKLKKCRYKFEVWPDSHEMPGIKNEKKWKKVEDADNILVGDDHQG